MNNKIIENKIQCRKCGDIIESTFAGTVVFCKCGSVKISGGYTNLERFNLHENVDYKECSKFYITE